MHTRRSFGQLCFFSAAVVFGIGSALPAQAQAVRLPRATAPVTLLGFESPDADAAWTGMKCRVTMSHASEGKSALSVSYPKWKGTGDQYLPATIAWADGRGYSTKDWSHYGKAAFDVWVDGKTPLQITVELSQDSSHSPFAKELVVQPGRKNTFELTMQDAAEVIDVSDIRSITLYGIRPAQDTTLTLDNFRLLPGNKPPIAAFDLIYPNYRDTVYPGSARLKAGVHIDTAEHAIDPAGLVLTLSASGGKAVGSAAVRITGSDANASIPAAKLPAGAVTLTARVSNWKGGKVIASRIWRLHKLTNAEVAATKVYIDARNNLVANGKPFFPIGWYGNSSLDQLEEIADSPFNTVLPYGVNTRSKAYVTRYLDLVQRHGLKMIYCMNDVYPTATFLENTGWEGVMGNNNIADAVVKTFKDHPAVLAWYLNDERPKELIPKLQLYYDRVRKNDPSHPNLTVIYQLPEVPYFSPTTDIMGVDRYPIPTEPVTVVSNEMQVSADALKGHKPAWAVIQAFGWYQYNVAFPDRGRIPAENELQSGRAPTYDEQRCMTYLALIHGAKGLLYYCYYDMRVLPQYAEMWGGIKKIAAEVKALSPILLEGQDMKPAPCSPADAGVETRLIELDGQRYLIAANTRNTRTKATFGLPHTPEGKVSVMFEGRFAMDVAGTKLTDSFKPLEVHVYDLGASPR